MDADEQKRQRQAIVDGVRFAVQELNNKLDFANTNGVRFRLTVEDTLTVQRVAIVSAEHVQAFNVH